MNFNVKCTRQPHIAQQQIYIAITSSNVQPNGMKDFLLQLNFFRFVSVVYEENFPRMML